MKPGGALKILDNEGIFL